MQNLDKTIGSKDVTMINLLDGNTTSLSHIGQVELANDLLLENVLCMSTFKFLYLS